MRLVDADKLYPDCMTKNGTLAISQTQIANAPSVDTYTIEDIQEVRENSLILGAKLAQRPQGEWIDINKQGKTGDGRTFTFPITICSVCKKTTGELYNFCPNCGAEMRKGGKEE